MSMNPYARLVALLPKRPLLSGVVVEYSNGVALIEMPGGGTDSARGDVTVGDRVFFRDGLIEGPATALTPEIIEV